MHILSWNIRYGGQDRLARIAAAIRQQDPDVVVLSEFQTVASKELLESLGDEGWCHQITTEPPSLRGGLAVVSKMPVLRCTQPASLAGYAFRYLPFEVPSATLDVRAIYAPLHREPYPEFWRAVLASVTAEAGEPVLMIGDFNAGQSLVDSPAADVLASSYFCRLPACGYTDLWRHGRDAGCLEPTWLGPVNPYRLDHAFGSESVLSRLANCTYNHLVREAGDSDHSSLSVYLNAAA
jgi:endonuclease/exonuclease/phosphatase family metal-dependent hydrolase